MPYSLLWLAFGEPELKHPKRLQIATELLDTPIEQLHIAGRKIVQLFRNVLVKCVENGGAICITLFVVMRFVACNWRADTSEMESIMNLISIATRMGSSQISLALVDARVASVKALGLGSRANKGFKYSQVKDKLEALVDDAAEHLPLAPAIMGDPDLEESRQVGR